MFTIIYSLKNPRDFTRFKNHDLFNQDKRDALIETLTTSLSKRLRLFGNIQINANIAPNAHSKDSMVLSLRYSPIAFYEDITFLPQYEEFVLELISLGASPEQIPTAVPLPPLQEEQYIEKCALLSLLDLNLSELLQVEKIELAPELAETVNNIVLPGIEDEKIDLQTSYVNEKQKAFEDLDIPSSWLPEEFFCIISTELMDYPVRLNDNKLINHSALLTHWIRNKTNPFTNEVIGESDIQYDWDLEERIDNFLKNAARIKKQKGELNEEDVTLALEEPSALYEYKKITSTTTEAELSLHLAKRYIKNNHFRGAEQLLLQGLSQLDTGEVLLKSEIHLQLYIAFRSQKNANMAEEHFNKALQVFDDLNQTAINGLINLGHTCILRSDYIQADRCFKKAVVNLNRMLDEKVGHAPLSEINALDETLKNVNSRRRNLLDMLPVKEVTTLQRFWRSRPSMPAPVEDSSLTNVFM